jgi:hypothetical protein
LITRFIKDFDA